MKKFLSVLLSVLFVPALMLLLFELGLRVSPGNELFLVGIFFLGFPLGIVLWFLIAGAILTRKNLLSRKALWLWMNLLGYPLAWAAFILRRPSLLMQGFWLLFFFLPITGILILAWLLIALVFLILRLIKSPPSRQKIRRLTQGFLRILTAVAAVIAFISAGRYINIRPAGAYTDQGVYTFIPVSGYPTNVKVPGSQKTRNVYKITYRTTTQSPYTHTVEAPSRSAGEATVKAKEPVEWRVLSINNITTPRPDGEGNRGTTSIDSSNTFITIPPEETAESYTAKEQKKCVTAFAISAGYLTAAAVTVIWRKRKAEDRAAETQL